MHDILNSQTENGAPPRRFLTREAQVREAARWWAAMPIRTSLEVCGFMLRNFDLVVDPFWVNDHVLPVRREVEAEQGVEPYRCEVHPMRQAVGGYCKCMDCGYVEEPEWMK